MEITSLDLKPMLNNLYFEWQELPNKIGGVLISDFHRVAVRKAVVRAVGPTCELVKPGDKILVSIHTGVHLFLCMKTTLSDGENHRICREDEIMSLYADNPEEAKIIDARQKKQSGEFLKAKKKEQEG